MTAPGFTYRSANTSRGLISAGEGSTEFYHPLLSATLLPAAGFLLILNGWNLNRSMADVTGHDGAFSTAIRMLQMRAPREPLAPLVSWPGEGRVFRPGAKWRYRWANSRTGEHSGLSPLPDVEVNMGVETPEGGTTYLGQRADFHIGTANKPAHADTIQLFANTTQQDETWYLADEAATGTVTHVLLTDDNTDDELFTKLFIVEGRASSTPSGMTWAEGIMDPRVKAWLDPSGRTRYFGLRRFGREFILSHSVTVTQGSDLVSINANATARRVVEPGRVGQRVRFFTDASGTEIADQTVYRFLKGESASTFRVWPELVTSTTLAEGATATTWRYSIEDDRDARWTWISEPNKPWLIDPKKTLAAGDDFDDGAMAWFALPDGRVFVQTKRRIYEAAGSVLDDPSRSTIFIPRVDEGTPGFFSGCETPFGWVYLHETRGIRLFDGAKSSPLDGVGDPFGEFLPKTQFAGFEQAAMEEVRLLYDPQNPAVVVSYVPAGGSTRRETLGFGATDRVWRGPNRERISAHGTMRSTSTSDVLVTGDDLGNLCIREAQALDVTPTLAGFAGTGTISSVQTPRIFTASAAAFNGDLDERVRGSPIWFRDTSGNYYFARVTDVLSSTQLELDGPPVNETGATGVLSAGMTFGLGSLRWSITMAYIDDGGDPSKPIEAFKIALRFKRGSSSETFEIGAAEDANTVFNGVQVSTASAAAPTRDVNGNVHGELRLKRRGALFQLRARGIARAGEPEIARAVLVAEAREGALPS